jgi:hypothetical protein
MSSNRLTYRHFLVKCGLVYLIACATLTLDYPASNWSSLRRDRSIDNITPSRRVSGSNWIIVRADTATGSERYYMAGTWVSDVRYGKRIRGYGNALRERDKISDERGFPYEIRPSN